MYENTLHLLLEAGDYVVQFTVCVYGTGLSLEMLQYISFVYFGILQ
jgi:hypothetical protein